MANNDSSGVVAIVAIVIIVLAVLAFAYYFLVPMPGKTTETTNISVPAPSAPADTTKVIEKSN